MHNSRGNVHFRVPFLSGCLVLWFVIQSLLYPGVVSRDAAYVASLRRETEALFYHGFENYMKHGFPEDELRPVSCKPLSRDRNDPSRVDLNDALGNYSLTLIDSLSTLAILASSPSEKDENKAWRMFQDGVRDIVVEYGDGTEGKDGQGRRARGFSLDSKVQVFETVIRGLGGLLSAHLFAVGDLPITGYDPLPLQAAHARQWRKESQGGRRHGIMWDNGFVYDGQLLRLAYDLGQRLLPAFWTPTGIPYPRVNLQDGIPFYTNSPYNQKLAGQQCVLEEKGPQEVTETCTAGAGTLVLEFTVLSRLTGDARFEELGKRAFWAIWKRRSDINLLGTGIDSETGAWVQHYSGIGAGIDSFFEYAFKSFVLLSSDHHPLYEETTYDQDPRISSEAISSLDHLPAAFLEAWEVSHAAIERHLLRVSNYQHPHYIVGDLNTGAARAFWIDALSAFYPGLLTISGYVEEAIESHLLSTALWTRFSALPERWNLVTGDIEGGLGWWVGRPEFIESNYYLYRATEDPWYQYVAEMTLRDIKRRCWTKCGWSGLQNVVTGEKSDRMESFFLGETAKYLLLTFDEEHPLNKLNSPYVFSTEGHPLIIPPSVGSHAAPWNHSISKGTNGTCPARHPYLPLTISSTAARGDVYHAGSLARLHLMPTRPSSDSLLGEYAPDHPGIGISDLTSPSNYTYYPWTLPPELIPFNAVSTKLPTRPTFEITFPDMASGGQSVPPLQRVKDGILINFMGGLRIGLIQDSPLWMDDRFSDGYRVHSINNVGLGKDEKVFLARDTGMNVLSPTDPDFTRIRDTAYIDLVVETHFTHRSAKTNNNSTQAVGDVALDGEIGARNSVRAAWKSLISQLSSLMQDPQALHLSLPIEVSNGSNEHLERFALPAIIPTGIGAAPIPDWTEAPSQAAVDNLETSLSWDTIYATDDLCGEKLPQSIPRRHQVIIAKRGNCSFSKKLSNIPAVIPSPDSLQLVIVVNYKVEDDGVGAELLFRPLLDQVQMTRSGLPRQYPLAMVMVAGGSDTYEALRTARGIGFKRRYSIRTQGIPITNLVVV